MTEKQFSEIQANINNLTATLLAGFSVLAGMKQAEIEERELLRSLSTEEWITAVHTGLDTIMMLKDNANQLLAEEASTSGASNR